jgi:orotate phosphoribosyltransferase-like protein
MSKITEKETLEIIELRRSGETLRRIADKYHLTGERVRQIVAAYNATADSPVTVRMGHRDSSPTVAERRQKVAELRQSGMTLAKIAETLDVPKHTVIQDCRILKKSGVLPEKKSST